MERNVANIGGRRLRCMLLFLLVMALMLFPNTSAKSDMGSNEEKPPNITMEPYNFTTESEILHDRSVWGMRLFGRLLLPTPIVQRALSDMLYVLFDCGKCSPDVKEFHIKKYSHGSSWSTVPRENWWRDLEYYGGGYFVWKLDPNTKFIIRALLTSGTTVGAFGGTCGEDVGYVQDLHVANIAACWLDVRFRDPNQDCDGKYYFKFKYHNTESIMTRAESTTEYSNPVTRFGMYFMNDSPGPRWIWDSLHPCPKYPHENCLFLGEHVRPNLTHTISVQAIRFGSSSWEEKGDFAEIDVTTNRDHTAFPPTFCPVPRETVPLWIVILLGFLIILTIVGIIIIAELYRKQKKKKKELDAAQKDKKTAGAKKKKARKGQPMKRKKRK